MNFLRLWCADICETKRMCGHLNRFRFTCFSCRTRRRLNGKFSEPPYWINYTFPWGIGYYLYVNSQNQVIAKKTTWRTIKIDPRGHFTMLRCCIIVAFDKIMRRFEKLRRPLMEFCEFFANYPTW